MALFKDVLDFDLQPLPVSRTLESKVMVWIPKKSEYDQEISQSHTADQSTAPWGRATEHSTLSVGYQILNIDNLVLET